MELEQARKAERDAQSALNGVDRDIRAEITEATKRIHDAWAQRRAEAVFALGAARSARIAVEDETPAHKWEGRKVFSMVSQGSSWQRLPEKRIEGIVETYRSTTRLPDNTADYRRPAIGQAIVRLLKKDGSPGSKFEIMGRWSYRPWNLVEQETEQAA